MGLIERLPQQPHHIRLDTTDKGGRTGILGHRGTGFMVTSRNISTGSAPHHGPRKFRIPPLYDPQSIQKCQLIAFTVIPHQRRQSRHRKGIILTRFVTEW
jgi:hypothetical protein